MRAKEVREFSTDEILQRELEIAEEIFRLRMRKSTGQLDNPMRLRLLRRDLARIKTIKQERSQKETGA